jgi:hypothetical protein
MKKEKKKRELLIENKIFTKDDLIALIKLFISLSNVILEKSKGIKKKELISGGWHEANLTDQDTNTSHSGIELSSSDNLKFSFSFEEISEAISILDNNQVNEVELYFRENALSSKFVIKLRRSDHKSNSSYALAEGLDKEWVEASIAAVRKLLETFRDQSAFVKQNRIAIISVTIVMLILFLHNLTEFFIRTRVMFPKIVGSIFTENLIYVAFVYLVISVTPAILIYRWLRKLYPGIEIETGDDHLQAGKKRLKKVLLMIALILIPTVLSFLLVL